MIRHRLEGKSAAAASSFADISADAGDTDPCAGLAFVFSVRHLFSALFHPENTHNSTRESSPTEYKRALQKRSAAPLFLP